MYFLLKMGVFHRNVSLREGIVYKLFIYNNLPESMMLLRRLEKIRLKKKRLPFTYTAPGCGGFLVGSDGGNLRRKIASDQPAGGQKAKRMGQRILKGPLVIEQ